MNFGNRLKNLVDILTDLDTLRKIGVFVGPYIFCYIMRAWDWAWNWMDTTKIPMWIVIPSAVTVSMWMWIKSRERKSLVEENRRLSNNVIRLENVERRRNLSVDSEEMNLSFSDITWDRQDHIFTFCVRCLACKGILLYPKESENERKIVPNCEKCNPPTKQDPNVRFLPAINPDREVGNLKRSVEEFIYKDQYNKNHK